MRWRLSVLMMLSVVAAAAASAGPQVDYARQIKPLLHEKCFACHGALKQKADLRLDAAQLLRAGGETGPVVVPGNADDSLLAHAIEGTHDVEKMPKDGAALTAEQVKLVRDWIDGGAKAPEAEDVPADPKDHWAFRPPTRPTLPPVADARWGRNPIDAFVSAAHNKAGLTPLTEAPKHVLLRRVYVDLVGVPPTVGELRAFLSDESPDAYERVVDRLLADPRHGQRWARHWMDVWRYSDWSGFQAEVRESRPGVWRWRDWIVESLNADVPYDQMVRLMLAADELAPADTAALRAGGYLARSWYKFNKNVWLDNTIEHAGKAFLGLTLNCAKCHDHKYDPVSQAEYYQFRAFFEPLDVRSDRVAGSPDPEKDGLAFVYDKDAAAPTYLYRRGDEKQPDKARPLPPVIPAVFGPTPGVKPVELPAAAYYPGLRPEVRRDLLKVAREAVEAARAELGKVLVPAAHEYAVKAAERKVRAAESELASVEARLAADAARYGLPPDLSWAPAKVEVLARTASTAERAATIATAEANLAAGEKAVVDATNPNAAAEARKKLEPLRKSVADALAAAATRPAAEYAPLTPVYPTSGTGRRSALAAWVTARDNPLAARVAVNQMWMRHVGEPLVPTVFDFGLNGKPPTNPALLDCLAVELVEHGWSMRHVHKLIVTSATYRLASAVPAAASRTYAENARLDPDNTLLWRANARRMEAEAVRDAVLAVSGRLDPAAGGPELDQAAWQSTARRSLYYRHASEKQAVFLQVFDGPSPTECYRRAETVTPQQSLALANSPLALSAARALAAELGKQAGDGPERDGAFVAAAYERVLNRPPTPDERAACAAYLSAQADLLRDPARLTPFAGGEVPTVRASADPRRRAREDLVHVLLNHNDFVMVR